MLMVVKGCWPVLTGPKGLISPWLPFLFLFQAVLQICVLLLVSHDKSINTCIDDNH